MRQKSGLINFILLTAIHTNWFQILDGVVLKKVVEYKVYQLVKKINTIDIPVRSFLLFGSSWTAIEEILAW